MTRQRWSPEVVVETIKELHAAGSQLSHSYVRDNHRTLLWAANKYIGTWKEAIEAAGLDYSEISLTRERKSWGKDRILEEIRELRKKGEALNSNSAQTKHPRLYHAATKYFGSWGDAVTAAGFDYSKIRLVKPFRPCTKDRVIADIRARQASGKHLGGGAISKDDRGLYSAAKRSFPGPNSWERALRAAGIDPDSILDPKTVWTKQKVLAVIKKRHAAELPLHGFYLSSNGLGGLLTAGRRIFGSWKETIEAAGLDYEEVRAVRHDYWTLKTVIEEIRKLASEGVRLNLKKVQSQRADLVGGAIKCFGSWDRAVTAAGFNYQEHSMVRSSKAWLNQLEPVDYEALMRQGRVRLVETRRTRKRKGTR